MAHSASFIIGIDTGGTYTDAVLIDIARHVIVASAKSLTTKGDLSLGVADALAAAIAKTDVFDPALVKMVSVSTTLATNAVVEGHGGSAGLVLAGFDEKMEQRTGVAAAFPNIPIIRIAGGHDHYGTEAVPLDLRALKAWLYETKHDVTAFAVASAFAVRNPAHEIAMRDLIHAETGRPVTLSSELASALDAPRRAQTALLNARLVSQISDLVRAVHEAMARHKLQCPLMLVKGDGSLIKAEIATKRPIETVLSGPAASMVGAQWLSGRDDFIMSDMGGTTTDVGMLVAGRPLVAEQGAEVGGWRTMVKAIDIKTVGLGGDSEVQLAVGGAIGLGPQRAVPIALLAQRFPEIIDMLLADLSDSLGGSMHGKFLVLPFGATGAKTDTGLTPKEREVLAEVTVRPVPFRKIATGSAAQRAIAALRKKGFIQFSAFTPSDAAHVLKFQNNWSHQGAEIAGKLLVRFHEMRMPDGSQVEAFCQRIWDRAVALSAKVVLDTAFGKSHDGELVWAVCNGQPELARVNIALKPLVPIVAVGGPAKIYYPEVGKRLGCDVVFANHYDVANAVGAAAGLVAHQIQVQVEGDGNGVFRVTGQGPVVVLSSPQEALSLAEKLARDTVLAQALAQGALNPKVKIKVQKHHLPDSQSDDGLVTATITAEARGAPVTVQN